MNFEPFQLPVSRIVRQTPEAVEIFFNDSEHPIAYKAGQFLTLEISSQGQKVRRSYSLCTAPGIDSQPAVCAKRVPGGVASTFLLDELKEGDKITLFPAIGNFCFQPDESRCRHILLVGAGSGITPLMAIAKSALYKEPGSFVSLVYGNRTPDSIIFKNEIQQLEAEFTGRFRVVHVLSGMLTGPHTGPIGRVTGAMVEELLYHMKPLKPVDSTEAYLCGPQGMMESVEKQLKSSGDKTLTVHRESFFSDAVKEYDAAHAADAPSFDGPAKVTIYLDGDEFTVEVPEGETILQAALDQDVDMPYSCQSGLCTACRGKCLEGKVEMAETEGLSDAEIDKGYVLTCVGHPKTERVVIEIG